MESAQARKALLKATASSGDKDPKGIKVEKRATGKQAVDATPCKAAVKRDRGTPMTDKTPSTSTPNPKRSTMSSEDTPTKMDLGKTPKKSLLSD